jgi:menaquinone-specific isochorismate synthase
MSQKTTATINTGNIEKTSDWRFFSETIEIGRISPLSFLEAGSSDYK